MPPTPVPAHVDEFLRKEDGLVLLNMDESRLRLGFMRRDARVSLTVLDDESWYSHVSLLGRIVRIEDDPELTDIDRLAVRYTGKPFGTREHKRVSAWMEPERWHEWLD